MLAKSLLLNDQRPRRIVAVYSGWWIFYRRYIPNCAQIIAPITDFTRSRAAEIVKWEDSQEWAFNEIKHLLSGETILKLPNLDKEFILQTDASNRSLGGCLLQERDGCCTQVENYSHGNRITLLVKGRRLFWAVDKFLRYLYGQHFTLERDHRPLEYLQTSHSKNHKNKTQIVRYALPCQTKAHQFQIEPE